MALVDEVQAKLDSYKTPKQRKQRLKELERMRRSSDRDTITLDIGIEYGVLLARRRGTVITAKEMADELRRSAEAGEMPLYVTVDGQRLQVPQAAINRGIRH